jgi:hypothetical protein
MAADANDLAPYAYMNLYEMETALPRGPQNQAANQVDVVVQLDTPGPSGLRRLRVRPSSEPYDSSLTLKYFESRRETDLRSPVLEVLPEPAEASSADSARDLQSFLHWGITTHPARHYMVVVWGHGRGFAPAEPPGWKPTPGVLPMRGLAADETQGTYLSTPLLRDALKTVVAEDLGGRPFDVYASDACVMQSIEVATELRGIARFIVGSAQIQPFTGLPYRAMLAELASGRFGLTDAEARLLEKDADQAFLLARMLPGLMAATLRGDGLQARLTPDAVKSFTLSSLRASELATSLVPALHEVGSGLDASIAAAPQRRSKLGQRIERMPGFLGGATDLGFFLERMKATLLTSDLCRLAFDGSEETVQCGDRPTTQLYLAIGKAQAALHRALVSSAFGDDYLPESNPSRMAGFAGLSLWLPRSDRDYQNRIAGFSTSAFYQPLSGQPGFGAWLGRIFGAP